MIVITQGVITERASRIEIGTGLAVTQVLVDGDYVTKIDTAAAYGITQEQADIRYVQKTGDTMTGALTSSMLGSALIFTNATSAWILYPSSGSGPPVFTTRSIGTKIVLWPTLSGSAVDYALGINSNSIWYSVPQATSTYAHRWYAGITEIGSFRGDGLLTVSNGLTVTSGAFQALGATSHVFGITSGSVVSVILRSAAGNHRQLFFYSDSSPRWVTRANNTAESGSDIGSDYEIYGYSDAGVALERAFSIGRAVTAAVTFGRDLILLGRPVGGTQAYFYLQAPAGTTRAIAWRSGSNNRWIQHASSAAESGSDTGSNMLWNAYTDAAVFIDTPFELGRAAGTSITMRRNLVFSGAGLTLTGLASLTATALIGTLSTAAQPNITSVGTLTVLNVSGNITSGPIIILTGPVAGTSVFARFDTGGVSRWAFGPNVNTGSNAIDLHNYGTATTAFTISYTNNYVVFYGRLSNSFSVVDENSAILSNTHATGYGLYARGGTGSRYIAHFVTYNDVSALVVYSDKVVIPAGNIVYFDGGSNSYMREVSADVLQFVVGGVEGGRVTTSGFAAPDFIFQ